MVWVVQYYYTTFYLCLSSGFLNCLTQFKNWEFYFEVDDLDFATQNHKTLHSGGGDSA
jgi:hypothetical protein